MLHYPHGSEDYMRLSNGKWTFDAWQSKPADNTTLIEFAISLSLTGPLDLVTIAHAAIKYYLREPPCTIYSIYTVYTHAEGNLLQ